MAEPTTEKSNEPHFTGDPKDAPIPPPYLTKLSRPPSPGHLMEIRGVVNNNAKKVNMWRELSKQIYRSSKGNHSNLAFGQKFIIHGTPRGEIFSIDLIGPSNSVPFSFTPSFRKNQIVRNASKQGEWGVEETEGKFPFERDQDFVLIIQYDMSDIKYFVNRKQVGSFVHRFDDPERACTGMRILGPVEVYSVELAHVADSRIPVPLTVRLGQRLRAGETICIRGAVKSEASGFDVNFLRGEREEGQMQTVLQVDFRFDENAIIMNSFTDGAWGEAERVSMPLQKGDSFDVRIGVTVASMEISCNGNLIQEYKHRVPYDEITYIQINGDCTLTNVFGTGRRYFSVPWLTGFPDGNLKTGQSVQVHGVSKGNSWNLDLLDTNDDILFRFSPRFDNKQIVRNSSKAGQWANEESSGPFPFEMDQPFDLIIENDPSSLKVGHYRSKKLLLFYF
ncbi:unnamed protein product [Haemonchus placei]|uniref:Galectin n=1 Tax=Haemonchus placei TaxID=6290 RepID=A0A0N4WWX9_HAEPC|nr:unnamed protein product [Haemonchus placei]